MFNEDVKKKFGAVVGKRQEVAGKQEVKILSAYTSTLDHLAWFILEAPSQQAVENYFTEIGFAFWNSVEIRQVKLVEDVIKKVTGE
jgi:hypothetical protein